MADDVPADGSEERDRATGSVVRVDHRNQRIGLGMLASLVVGYAPLRDAVTGTGSFEGAVGRYLLCLGASVGAALLIGRLLDGAASGGEHDGAGAADRGPARRP